MENSIPANLPRPTWMSKRWVPHLAAVLAFALLVLVTFLFWAEISKRFPKIEPGSYIGSLGSGVFSESGGEIRFYVERTPEDEDLFFVVIRPGWTPQVVSSVVSGSDSASGEWLLPITLTGPEGRFRFIGSRVGPGDYRGTAKNLNTGVESSWVLQAIREENPSRVDSRLAEMRLWLLLDSELKEVSNQIVLAERRVPEQRLEIERLTQVLGEGQKFRSKANEKFTLAQQELKQAQTALIAKREEVASLEAAYDLAQRVTPMGRLVSLSRESLEREWRWVDSAIKSQGPVQTEEFLAAIEKGEKILALKREIALEEIKIRALGGDVGTEDAVLQEPEERVRE